MERLKRENYAAQVDGKLVDLYVLKNAEGMEVALCNWGARVSQILTPDKNGRLDDVTLGYDTLAEARAGLAEMGAVIGRVANRIAGARFELAGRVYPLAANDGRNNLHSGPVGCMNSIFDVTRADSRSLSLSLLLPDGMDGFPGNCMLSVVYTLSDENDLIVDYDAVTDATTIVNFCNHAYFNLAGTDRDAPDILGHRLQLNARRYTLADRELIPTGEIAPVAGTPFDFTTPRPIEERIGDDNEQLEFGRGYDHNFVLDKTDETSPGVPVFAARLSEPISGRVMEVWTTEPGIQLYTGNFLQSDGMRAKYVGKGGRPMSHRGALCLETQRFPDAVHHPNFPSMVLNPGERYRSTTVFKFRV
ncbi:MAG: galactose mutarotase [Synergistaceae bacterium]|jgi:aldose 1-epimerase|nr:galactose mutarotase [Synergistaceae bacterium]